MEPYIESSNNDDSSLLLGIFANDANMHIGNVHLSQIKPYHSSCYFGVMLQKDFIEKGYAYEVTVWS